MTTSINEGERAKTSSPDLSDGRVRRAHDLRAERRKQLLDTACEVCARQGYRETMIQDLLDAADVARGTFYQHFKGKRAIFDALLDGLLVALSAAIVRIDIHSEVSVNVQLTGNVNRVLDVLWTNAGLTRIFLRQAVGLDPELDLKLHTFDDQVLSMIEGSLSTGVAIGLVRPGPIRLRAVFLLGTVKEVAVKVRLHHHPCGGLDPRTGHLYRGVAQVPRLPRPGRRRARQ